VYGATASPGTHNKIISKPILMLWLSGAKKKSVQKSEDSCAQHALSEV
jgi:hypothetical protein